MTNWQTKPSAVISGAIKVSGDKSISHRSIMFAALAEGRSEITGFLQGEDCIATRKAFEAMGVNIRDEADKIVIDGVGLHGLKKPQLAIDVGNSGTGMRLLAGVLAGQNFSSTLIGDASLMQRPMKRVAEPLSAMGANVNTLDNGCAPITISPAKQLRGIECRQQVASAQVKSAILLAGLYADGEVVVHEPGVSRDHTERMLRQFGYAVETIKSGSHRTTRLTGGGKLTATNITVPSDISSAAFFMVAGAISPCQGEIRIAQVGINPTRTGVINILRLMGADLRYENECQGAEPVADIAIKPSRLKGINVPVELVPLAIDEFPVIFVAAACADGEFVLRGARELRVKESDRIEAMAVGLTALGVNCQVLEDGLIIRGNPDNPFPNAATVDSLTDHRIAMAFAVAGIRAQHGMRILHCDNVATSFPNFAELAEQVGLFVDEVSA
ncbi:MAG: 3-phosphoshikimate 1-carboxyvinyltransferase [Gammaproteobacteria bacterium]|nr:MAG: 3-phosphoshikimate 1-carboxyvinyltransferase [Gammaproteobacteria bacterium]